MKDPQMFMIRSKKTGLFSKGGQDGDGWNRAGKVWKRKGDLSSHFTNLSSKGRNNYRDHDAEVIEFEIVTVGIPVPVETYMYQVVERIKERHNAAEAQVAQRRLDLERAEYQRLHRKFGATE